MLTKISSVSLAKKNGSRSFRTTVPLEISQLLELNEGDKLLWIYDKNSNKVIVEKYLGTKKI